MEANRRMLVKEVIYMEKNNVVNRRESHMTKLGIMQHSSFFMSFFKAPKKIIQEIITFLYGNLQEHVMFGAKSRKNEKKNLYMVERFAIRWIE